MSKRLSVVLTVAEATVLLPSIRIAFWLAQNPGGYTQLSHSPPNSSSALSHLCC